MSETLVGLTIVAMGTSLPELVTSAVAASKGEADLAIGNVVGSNLSNILLVLGLSAAISSVGVTAMNFVDIIVSLAATIIVFIVASTQRTIKKKEGIFLVIIYAFYMAYIICRQIYEKRASRFVKLFPCKKDATHASFPQIYSNNKKGRESD